MTRDGECPYGASSCPKIDVLLESMERSNEDIVEMSRSLASLTATLKTVGCVISLSVTIACAIIGVVMA